MLSLPLIASDIHGSPVSLAEHHQAPGHHFAGCFDVCIARGIHALLNQCVAVEPDRLGVIEIGPPFEQANQLST
jgi:hypothetical protein